MENQRSQFSSQTVALAFLGGAVAGVVASLLLAPKSGEDTRQAVKGYARRAEEEALEKAKEARAALDDTIERGKHFLREKAGDVEAVAKAGGEAVKQTMDKCCS